MNIRKALLLELLSDLEMRMTKAQWELTKNKHQINLLAKEQRILKEKRQEIGKLLGELKRQMK